MWKDKSSDARPTLPGWKVETVGDDIAWMRFGEDGHLYAINPEAGFFGVAPGTSLKSNPNTMHAIEKNTIFTNVALKENGDVWWEGMTATPPEHPINWLGHEWTPKAQEKAAHPNARFTVSIAECPSKDEHWDSSGGVPISAIIFGGRRTSLIPLVYEAFNWQHGTFLGASISSETTAAAEGKVGALRHDPFAMLPFCGYNMGDYFAHWLKMGKGKNLKLPRIFTVNWFRKGKNGEWLWPGFGENSRVLKWIFERITEEKEAVKTPIGYLPSIKDLDLSGLDVKEENIVELLKVDPQGWKKEVEHLREYFSLFGNKLPLEISEELNSLEKRLGS